MPDPDDDAYVDKPIRYPHRAGDTIVLGPQIFASQDESVINWKGVNYYPEVEPPDDDDYLVVAQTNQMTSYRDAEGREFQVSTSVLILQVKPDDGGKWTATEGPDGV